METGRSCAFFAAVLSMASLQSSPADAAGASPGAPGAPSVWAPAQKSFLGTSRSETSRVYFTGYHGIVSEVFYPVLDSVNTVDLQFLVGDAARSFVDEEKLQSYTSAPALAPPNRTMRWQVVTENLAHHWRITKRVFTDPDRNTLVLRTTFQALDGKSVGDFNVYLLHNPAMDNSGANDTSRTLTAGHTMLVASQNARASALTTSLPWKTQSGETMVSNGFVGVTDGWTDLLAGASDKTMNWSYSSATNGNVAQMGWVDLGTSGSSASFDVVLAFGSTETEAMTTANATLGSPLALMEATYDSQWQTYADGLDDQGGTADDQYYLAAMAVKCVEDKSNEAMIAGLGTPWGDTNGDSNPGGYHLVWPRDLFKFANALVTAGDMAAGSAVVGYLFNTLQQSSGRFPQNAWVDGREYWHSTQMDEQGMPILLAWRVYEKGNATIKSQINALWPKIRLTGDFLANTGPWTDQDRWEENSGYSPATIAAEVAGLVAAAEFAKLNGDVTRAARYLSAADCWQQNVTGWTFTTNGSYGDGRYFLRLNPSSRRSGGNGCHVYDPTNGPNDAISYEIRNGGGWHDQRQIVDGGFLELVRMGVKGAKAPEIEASLQEYDQVLKQTIDGNQAWFRYNCDGYGEHNDGSNFNGTGRGRLWPIFTEERGMYEIARARAANESDPGGVGESYREMVKSFTTPEGFIPEQVWNITANVGGCDVTTPPPFVPGTPTKSIAPLSWAMGEYISLVAAINADNPVDIPSIVCGRYNNCVVPAGAGQIGVNVNVRANTTWGQMVYVTGNVAPLGNWNTNLGIPTDPATYPTWKNHVNLASNSTIEYKYYRKNDDGSVTWENIPGGGNRSLSTPASGTVTLNDTVNW